MKNIKKPLKICLFIIIALFIVVLGFALYCVVITAGAKIDENKFLNTKNAIEYYDCENNLLTEKIGDNAVTDFCNVPEHVKNAFIAIEDKRFYSHNGVDYKGLFRSVLNNIKSFSFKEGGSTITQQLIKNTHLTNEKTLKRKLVEIKLAKKLENKYSKDKILETYLNTIYFGNNCYGITAASKNYFSKKLSELNVNESAMLAGIIKAPSYYSPLSNEERCLKRKNTVLKEMLSQGYIDKETFDNFYNKKVELKTQTDYNDSYLGLIRQEMEEFMDKYPKYQKKYKVYTNYDAKMQNILNNSFDELDLKVDKSAIIIDNDYKIRAFFSTCGNFKRQMGSTAKPLFVYAPAIELNTVCPCTKVTDKETLIDGYKVKNYKDKYYGVVSVKESLSKSLNSCAVQILNATGIEKSLSFVKKTDIEITDKDYRLSAALGNTENGAKITEIVGAYNVFANNGEYKTPKGISKITDENGKVLYKNELKKEKVFSSDTVSLINHMLKDVVENGTAKKLSFCNLNLYAKTGTVGTENGNTDAYTISYTKDYSLGVWLGNEDCCCMKNEITGGSYPADVSAYIWKELYACKNCLPIKDVDIEEVKLDGLSLSENKIELSEDIAPKKYIVKEFFKKSNMPQVLSKRFSSPEIENCKTQVKNNVFSIELCVAQYVDYKIYKSYMNKKELIYDSKINGKKNIITDSLKGDIQTCVYSVIPYYKNEDGEYYGEEIFLDEIKLPSVNLGNNEWWIDLD